MQYPKLNRSLPIIESQILTCDNIRSVLHWKLFFKPYHRFIPCLGLRALSLRQRIKWYHGLASNYPTSKRRKKVTFDAFLIRCRAAIRARATEREETLRSTAATTGRPSSSTPSPSSQRRRTTARTASLLRWPTGILRHPLIQYSLQLQ